MVRAGARGCAVLFRYGVVVMFNLDPVEEAAFIRHLEPLVKLPFTAPEHEATTLRFSEAGSEGVENDTIALQQADPARLQIVADILGKSVVMGHHEAGIAQVFELVEPLARELERSGRVGGRGKELLRHIGGALIIEHRMVGRVEVTEKPEILWDHPELERLYARLEDEYELRERHVALERKLELITRTAQTALELLQSRHTLRVEWYIVLLIVVEILLTLYELFVH